MNGWVGKILKVDLTSGAISEESTIPKYEKFVGGSGIGFRVIWDEVSPEAGAFDAENRIVFAAGPLVGTEAPGATRTLVTSKSPQVYEHCVPERSLTTCSAMGGPFGSELKFAGYDAVVVSGNSPEPVYLWIHDGQAEIRDARNLWGLDAYETPSKIREELQDGYVQVASIGQAGENLVRAACVVSRGRGDHAAAQGGFGAVMGSKKLKAVAVRGTQGMAAINIARPEEFREVVGEALHLLTPLACNPNSMFWNPGVDPHSASQFGHWQRADIGKFMSPELKVHHVGRVGDCPLLCYDQYDVPGVGSGAAMCSKYNAGVIGVGSIEGFRMKDFGDRYGINMMDLHLMIPWLRSLFKKGVLTEEKTGIPFSADSGEAFVRNLFDKITFREGFGDTLAEGTVRAAKELGLYDSLCEEELADFLAIPAQLLASWCSYGGHGFCGECDPRNWIAQGVYNAVHHREPSVIAYWPLAHYSSLPIEAQRAIAAVVYGSEDAVQPQGEPKYCRAEAQAAAMEAQRCCIKDALTTCAWSWPMYVSPYEERTPAYIGDTSLESKLFSAATGTETTEDELNKVGERIHNLMRAVMVREMGSRDMRHDHDVLPEHFFINPSPGSDAPPVDREKFDELLGMYYQLKGWDESGLPTRSKLEELDLKDVADSLEDDGLLGS
jgi:aldehyde:ferredoxin oxidoreductase